MLCLDGMKNMMDIGGPQLRQLDEALLSAFPTRDSLERMVQYRLNENLSAIAGNGNLHDTVFRLTQRAKARGRLKELILAAREENPRNPQLRNVALQLGVIKKFPLSPPMLPRLIAPFRKLDRRRSVIIASGFLAIILFSLCTYLAPSLFHTTTMPGPTPTVSHTPVLNSTLMPSSTSISLPYPIYPREIGVYPDEYGENIGLSDGSYALDVGNERPGSDSKSQASEALSKGDVGGATALWHQALYVDSSDAESLIYLENQSIRASGMLYATIVIGSLLADKPIDYSSRDELQGAYIAQKEYNDAAKVSGGLLLRLLIAKSGNNPFNSMKVANQIVQAALFDKTIIGVLGWATTRCSLNVLSILTNAHIPLLASSAAGDDLTSRSSYFFRVVPQNKKGAPVLAKYVETKLKLQRLVAVYEEKDAFSQNFVDTFTLQLTNDGQQAPTRLTYEHLSTPEKMAQVVQRVLEMQPDGVLLASSRSTDIANFRAALPRNSNVKVLASGVQYANANAPAGEYPGTPGLIFVSSGFPDEWSIIKPSLQAPSFFNEYKGQFDPYNQ
ncbi:MAG: hypothetical protein E6J34_00335, partial [Chloroflexi bacterium]